MEVSHKKFDSDDENENELEADVILNINNMQEFERQLNESSSPQKQNKIENSQK